MRALIQRVKKASVEVDEETVGQINNGILVFFATTHDDNISQIPWLVEKIINLRIFSDENGKLNLSLKDVKGEVLIVSQFTLYGDCMKGRRPSFIKAQDPVIAKGIYGEFISKLEMEKVKVETGVFGAKMEVSLINDGPITFMIDSK